MVLPKKGEPGSQSSMKKNITTATRTVAAAKSAAFFESVIPLKQFAKRAFKGLRFPCARCPINIDTRLHSPYIRDPRVHIFFTPHFLGPKRKKSSGARIGAEGERLQVSRKPSAQMQSARVGKCAPSN